MKIKKPQMTSTSTYEEIKNEVARRTNEKMQGTISNRTPGEEGEIAAKWNEYFRKQIDMEIQKTESEKK